MKKIVSVISITTCLISIFLAYFALVTTSLPVFFELLFQFMPQFIISSISPVLWWLIPIIAIIAAGVFAAMHLKCCMDFCDKFNNHKYSHSKLIFAAISLAIAYFLAQEFLEHLSTSMLANYLSYNALVVITILAGFFSLIFFLERGFDNIEKVGKQLSDNPKIIVATIIFASLLTLALSTIIIIPSQILMFAQIITINLVIIGFMSFVKEVLQSKNKIKTFTKLLEEIIQKLSLICHATAEAMLTGKGALISTSSIIFTISVIITKTLHEILVDLVEHEHSNNESGAKHEILVDLVEHEHSNNESGANSHTHELNNRQIYGLISLCITLFLFPLFNMPYPYFCSMIFSLTIYLITTNTTNKCKHNHSHNDHNHQPHDQPHHSHDEWKLFYNILSIIAVGAIGAVAGVEASLIFNIGFIPILFATIVSILTEGNVLDHVFEDHEADLSLSWNDFTTEIQGYFNYFIINNESNEHPITNQV